MPDWGVSSGPSDRETHAEKLMKSVIRKGRNPHESCECGGEFTVQDGSYNLAPKSIVRYTCESCGEHTYDWTDKHKPRKDSEYKWETS